LKISISKSWKEILDSEFNSEYFETLIKAIDFNYENNICYPNKKNIFSAFNHCDFKDLKVVIIGQDPYHGENQANGLAFSVHSNIKIPPSLKNILIEIRNDLNTNLRKNGDLKDWSKQGVLLLNSVLTVENGKPGSHSKLGWEKFTNQVIKLISKKKSNLVFMLWGGYAKKKEKIIYDNQHLILKSGHPSPLSANRGFWFGNKHFSKCNDFLIKHKLKYIKW